MYEGERLVPCLGCGFELAVLVQGQQVIDFNDFTLK